MDVGYWLYTNRFWFLIRIQRFYFHGNQMKIECATSVKQYHKNVMFCIQNIYHLIRISNLNPTLLFSQKSDENRVWYSTITVPHQYTKYIPFDSDFQSKPTAFIFTEIGWKLSMIFYNYGATSVKTVSQKFYALYMIYISIDSDFQSESNASIFMQIRWKLTMIFKIYCARSVKNYLGPDIDFCDAWHGEN
jgi:hypothetical protein